jgi:DNA-binding transcriptional MerR regulator
VTGRFPDERYIAAAELAQLMGVSVKTIRRLTTLGMPSETWGMANTRRYLASDCMAWARARATIRRAQTRRFTVAQIRED